MANTKKTFKQFLSENQNFWEDVGLSLYEDSDQDFVTYKYLKENYYTSSEVDEKISEVSSSLENYWSKDELFIAYQNSPNTPAVGRYVSYIGISNYDRDTCTQIDISYNYCWLSTLSNTNPATIYTSTLIQCFKKFKINGVATTIVESTVAETLIDLDEVYVLQTDLATTLADYVTSESLETTLGEYAKKEEIISELPSIYVNVISFGMQISNDEEVDYGGVSLTIIANKEFGEQDFVSEIASWLNENGFNSINNSYPLNPQSYKGSYSYYYCYSEDGSTIMLYNSSLNENNPTAVEGASLENYVIYKLQ